MSTSTREDETREVVIAGERYAVTGENVARRASFSGGARYFAGIDHREAAAVREVARLQDALATECRRAEAAERELARKTARGPCSSCGRIIGEYTRRHHTPEGVPCAGRFTPEPSR